MPDLEIIRDPLWDNVQLDQAALALLDTPPLQRLRYIRQLGHAFLVYPGATHTRFEHALGAYHLTRRALSMLRERGELAGIAPDDELAVRLAALVHDIGHYPFSHGLEEAGFVHHETLGVAKLHAPPLADVLARLGPADLADRVGRLIQGTSPSPLQGLISGTLDLDKIDYLSRDARACGVPYGTLDVDRLLSATTLVELDGQRELGVLEKGISALESMLFAKYQMYRNVYWHHAVRSATCMFKRAVGIATRDGSLSLADIADATDGSLMELLKRSDASGLARAVTERRLFKRALDLPASDVPAGAADWVWNDPALVERVEDSVAAQMGLGPAELLIDFPMRGSMLSVDLPLRTRDGTVERLTDAGRAGQLGLPRIAEELYRSARRLRVFTARPVTLAQNKVFALIERSGDEVRGALERGEPLLAM